MHNYSYRIALPNDLMRANRGTSFGLLNVQYHDAKAPARETSPNASTKLVSQNKPNR